jgi:hypothetical protein
MRRNIDYILPLVVGKNAALIKQQASNQQLGFGIGSIGLIGRPAAKEKVLKNSKLTNWEPNSLSGLSEDS